MNSENRIAELERELSAAQKERDEAREEIRRLHAECDRLEQRRQYETDLVCSAIEACSKRGVCFDSTELCEGVERVRAIRAENTRLKAEFDSIHEHAVHQRLRAEKAEKELAEARAVRDEHVLESASLQVQLTALRAANAELLAENIAFKSEAQAGYKDLTNRLRDTNSRLVEALNDAAECLESDDSEERGACYNRIRDLFDRISNDGTVKDSLTVAPKLSQEDRQKAKDYIKSKLPQHGLKTHAPDEISHARSVAIGHLKRAEAERAQSAIDDAEREGKE